MLGIGNLAPRQLTDEEIKQGAPLRKKAREKVEKIYTNFRDKDSKAYKIFITDSQLSPLTSFLESEIAWWNANVQLSPTQVETRITQFEEQYPIKREQVDTVFVQQYAKDFSNLKKDPESPEGKAIEEKQNDFRSAEKPGFDKLSLETKLTQALSQVNVESSKSDKPPEIPEEDKTTWDIAKEAFSYAMASLGLLVWFLLALRFAGFAASETLWRPLPYRILDWAYTFVFMPIFLPYYIYREIVAYVNPEDSLRWESVFPYKPYAPDDPNYSMERRLFGYTDTDDLRKWIESKKQAQESSWLAFLEKQKDFLTTFRQAKDEERVLQQQ